MGSLSTILALTKSAAPAAPAERRYTISERLGNTNLAIPPEQIIADAVGRGRLAPVSWSKDLARIVDLPRRAIDVNDASAAAKWTAALRRENPSCDCVARFGRCIRELLPVQGWALENAAQTGLLAPIGVGFGKTGIDILIACVVPGVDRAALFIPPSVKAQFMRDFAQWSAHFKTPNLVGGSEFYPGRPALRVITYSELSRAESTRLLEEEQPDLIIADEAHNFGNRKSARTKRFLRYMHEASKRARFCGLSGTFSSKKLADYAHLAELSLREGSPLPLHWPTVEEWDAAIGTPSNPDIPLAPIGELRRLCSVGETAREGFRRRLVETPGVVATSASALGTSLVISAAEAPALPSTVSKALGLVRESWQRPDGEELTDALTKSNVCRQLACGFFYRWRWIRGESDEQIRAWLEARKNYHKEVREKLKLSRAGMDSPLLLAQAAIRWHDGYVVVSEDGSRREFPPHHRHGPYPIWESEYWPAWKAIKDSCEPATEAVWIDSYLAEHAAAWAKKHVGIVWYEHDAFGRAIADIHGAPLFGPGAKASAEIIAEDGTRAIVASIKAHGTGKNLQRFSRNLITNPPSDGAAWEQLLGRTHRQGQLADVVEAEVYQHTDEMAEAVEKAISRARYIEETMGNRQKLLYATLNLNPE